ncbi:MAG: hypothetical protein ACSLE3_13875 [Microbacteriaceae bacterium]
MTTWHDKPMTRRELRERERISQANSGADQPTSDAAAKPLETPISDESAAPIAVATPAAPFVPAATADVIAPAAVVVPAARLASVVAVAPPAPAAPTAAAPAAAFDAGSDHTITRRELRALRESLGEGAATEALVHSLAGPAIRPAESGRASVAAEPAATPVDTSPAEAPATALVEPPKPFVPPVGHWSLQADESDQEFSSGAIPLVTSSTLIVPGPPGELSAPLTSAGDIIVTGTIDLPKRLATTGTVARLDSAEIDRLIEGDHDDSSSEVAPIRASRAFNAGDVLPETPSGGKGPRLSRTGLLAIIGGGALAVVVGIVILGYALNIL